MAMSDTSPKRAKSEPNIVPFTDILLVLLVIFMVATPFLRHPVNVDLPDAQNPTILTKSDDALTIHLAGDGRLFLNNARIDDFSKVTAAIEDQLQGNKAGRKVILRVDDAVEYGLVVDLMNEIKNAHIDSVSLLVKNVSTVNLP
jgi:biopolymer transport protein TolR